MAASASSPIVAVELGTRGGAIVIVDVIDPVIVAVHVNGNATVIVIPTVDAV